MNNEEIRETEEEIVDRLQEEYEVEREELQKDVREFIGKLQELGIL